MSRLRSKNTNGLERGGPPTPGGEMAHSVTPLPQKQDVPGPRETRVDPLADVMIAEARNVGGNERSPLFFLCLGTNGAHQHEWVIDS